MRRQFSGLVGTALMVVVLAGCAASGASETARTTLMTATETAAAEPPLPSLPEGTVPPEYEDQYLDLAVEVYQNYQGAVLRVLAQELDASALHDYVQPSMEDSVESVAKLAAEEGPWTVEGEYKLENTELTNSEITDEYVRLQFIACQIDGDVTISNAEHEHIRDRSEGDRWPIVVIVKGPIEALKVERHSRLGEIDPCEP